MPNSFRRFLAVLLAMLLISPGLFAFSSPFPTKSIREAYFLGQRANESTARLSG